MRLPLFGRYLTTHLLALCISVQSTSAVVNVAGASQPFPEQLDYTVEWHMINAGTVHLETTGQAYAWQIQMHVQSAGTVTRLYRVDDVYRVQLDGKVCPSSTVLDAQEGHKHHITKLVFDSAHNRVGHTTQDMVKNVTLRNDLAVAPCTREILTALMAMRNLQLESGKAVNLAITNGIKATNARIESQAQETISIDNKPVRAQRYEAFLFDNALFKRKGRLLVWLSQDGEALPLQFRFDMGFPIGSVLVSLHSHKRL